MNNFKEIEGIILRRCRWQEDDLILDILTSTEGKISVSVKGARKWRGRLEVLNQVRCTLYQGKRNNLQEISVVRYWEELKTDLEATYLAWYWVDLVAKLWPEHQACPETYALLIEAFSLVTQSWLDRQQLRAAVLVRLLSQTGWLPVVHDCAACGRPLSGQITISKTGEIICAACAVPSSAFFDYEILYTWQTAEKLEDLLKRKAVSNVANFLQELLTRVPVKTNSLLFC